MQECEGLTFFETDSKEEESNPAVLADHEEKDSILAVLADHEEEWSIPAVLATNHRYQLSLVPANSPAS